MGNCLPMWQLAVASQTGQAETRPWGPEQARELCYCGGGLCWSRGPWCQVHEHAACIAVPALKAVPHDEGCLRRSGAWHERPC